MHSAARTTTERKGYSGYGACLPNPKSVPEIGNVQYNDYAYMKHAQLQGGAPWLSNIISILTEVCGDYCELDAIINQLSKVNIYYQ